VREGDAAEVVVTLTNDHRPDLPLDDNKNYFIIGGGTYVREGLHHHYNFSVEQIVKIEDGFWRPGNNLEVLAYGRGSIVYQRSYMMGGANWLPTFVVVMEHRQNVSCLILTAIASC
jgi:hypothetical protein